jgi:hypothetical protein
MMKKLLIKCVFTVAIIAAFTNNAQAETRAECITIVGTMFVEGITAYQHSLRYMIIIHRPDLAPLAEIEMKSNIAGAQLQGAKIAWLATAHSAYLVTDEGTPGIINFSWLSGTDAEFKASNPEHITLGTDFQKWATTDDENPSWPATAMP